MVDLEGSQTPSPAGLTQFKLPILSLLFQAQHTPSALYHLSGGKEDEFRSHKSPICLASGHLKLVSEEAELLRSPCDFSPQEYDPVAKDGDFSTWESCSF